MTELPCCPERYVHSTVLSAETSLGACTSSLSFSLISEAGASLHDDCAAGLAGSGGVSPAPMLASGWPSVVLGEPELEQPAMSPRAPVKVRASDSRTVRGTLMGKSLEVARIHSRRRLEPIQIAQLSGPVEAPLSQP